MDKLCLLLLFCISIFKAAGQVGGLDSSFGINGIQKTTILDNINSLREDGQEVLTSANGNIFVVVQVGSSTRIARYLPDGRIDYSYGNAGYSNDVILLVTRAAMQGDKIIVSGRIYNSNSNFDFALARYKADGTLDSSFGEYGYVSTDFNGSSDNATSIALLDNKIIVAGSNDYDFALARYTADGMLDSSFGENGKVTTDFNGSYDEANSIVLQEYNIIVAGYSNNPFSFNSDFALARYTADGRLDSSFGGNGKVMTDFNSSDDQVTSIALFDNKIVVAGSTGNYPNYNFALARYTADGRSDSSFGGNGKVTTEFNGFSSRVYSISLKGDKIIVAGDAFNPINLNGDFALARYTAEGMLDSSFGENGTVITDFDSTSDNATSIALQGDKIIAAGSTRNPVNNTPDFALARYNADGALDASFGEQGLLTGFFPTNQTVFTCTIIQGNKIIAAGSSFNDNLNYDFALARYTADGKLDSSFGQNGKVTTDFSGYDNDFATSVAVQGDKIIVGGRTTYDHDDYYFALVRYTANGKLDSSFGQNGKVRTYFNSYSDEENPIVIQKNKIIVAVSADNFDNGTSDFALVRYTADGKLDSAFGQNGKVTTDFNSSNDEAYSLAFQGDKLILAGYTLNFEDYTTNFALTRYTANGTLDSSFGDQGKVTTDFNSPDDRATSIALQEDNIIVCGRTKNSTSNYDFALSRYTANGVLDSSFGNHGKVTTDFNTLFDFANSIVVKGDKIIVGGYAYGSSNNYDFALASFTADGRLDSSFGENGKVTTDLGGSDYIRDIALHQNRLYVAGSLDISTDESYGVVAAYQLEAPEPTIIIANVTVSESKKLAVATVHLSAPATLRVRVNYTLRNKTAVRNQDYIGTIGPLLFIPGFNNTAKVIIPIINDSEEEGDEQFEIVLTNARNATIQDSVAVVTIIDDDALITKQGTSLQIKANPNPSKDGFAIRLQGNNLKQQVSVRVYDVSGKLVEQRANVSIGQIFRLGDQYKAGTYIIEAAQGRRRVQTKMIKAGK